MKRILRGSFVCLGLFLLAGCGPKSDSGSGGSDSSQRTRDQTTPPSQGTAQVTNASPQASAATSSGEAVAKPAVSTNAPGAAPTTNAAEFRAPPPAPPPLPTPGTSGSTNTADPSGQFREVAVITTTAGTMVAEFWTEEAPKTVINFKKLARSGFFDGTAFHRIIKGFMIQGGDPKTKDPSLEREYGTGGPGFQIKAEFNARPHVRGVLSMARSPGQPDSAGSQFFIVLDRAPHLDRQYTGFGKVIKGEDVLMKIGETPVEPNAAGELSKPVTRIEIQTIKIVPANSI